MTTAIYEIMSKLVPDIMEMGMFLCVQITGKLFKFLYKQFIWIKSWSEEVYYHDYDYYYYNELVKQVITKLMLLLTNK